MTIVEWNLKTDRAANSKFYLGIDIARYGGDEIAFAFVELFNHTKLKCVKTHVTERVSTTDTIGRAVKFDEHWKFSKIFTDDSGVGGGVTDALQEKFG